MFIISKRNFLIVRADGSAYRIPRDYVGEIPADVAAHWLVQGAIKDGSIATPEAHSDRAIEAAEEAAEVKAEAADIRPDAKKKTRRKK